MAALRPLSHIHKISVFDTGIDDAAVEHLKTMTSLRILLIGRSKITESGSAALTAAIPGAALYREPMTRHIGIVACSAEGAALCYRTICAEGAQYFGTHGHPEVSMRDDPAQPLDRDQRFNAPELRRGRKGTEQHQQDFHGAQSIAPPARTDVPRQQT